MSIQASWLDKKWTIDGSTINGLNNISMRRELDVEENESKDGQNPTNTKGYKPQGLTTTHKVGFAVGTNPRQEYKAWQDRVGKRAGFHINGTRFGPPVLILDKAEFKATHISNTGQILEGEITLTFSEDVNKTIAPAAAIELFFGDIADPKTTPGYNPNAAAEVKSAYSIRPSASDTAAKT